MNPVLLTFVTRVFREDDSPSDTPEVLERKAADPAEREELLKRIPEDWLNTAFYRMEEF